MICEFDKTPRGNGKTLFLCKHCSRPQILEAETFLRECTTCKAGCHLTNLLTYLGQIYEPGCPCRCEAQKMESGNRNDKRTLRVMRKEAKKRNLTFVESQAVWLIQLAYKLSEENREPTKLERIRLRAIRLGNKVLNG